MSNNALECSSCGDRVETDKFVPRHDFVWCGRKMCLPDVFTRTLGNKSWLVSRVAGEFFVLLPETETGRPVPVPAPAPAVRRAKSSSCLALVARHLALGCVLGMVFGLAVFLTPPAVGSLAANLVMRLF